MHREFSAALVERIEIYIGDQVLVHGPHYNAPTEMSQGAEEVALPLISGINRSGEHRGGSGKLNSAETNERNRKTEDVDHESGQKASKLCGRAHDSADAPTTT